MSTKYLSCAETAKLVRQALKEAFPGIKFSVRSSNYSGGASMRIEWLDGPNTAQVEAVACRFKASYFDGGIDYKGSIYHMMYGQQVRFGADFIHCQRQFSDAAIQTAIDRTYSRYAGNFKSDGIDKPTVQQYRNGDLWSVRLSGLHHYGNQGVQADVSEALYKHSDRMKVAQSATAGRVFVTHDDGYSRTNGSGFSAVSLDA
ncbi:MAG: hypothetical protein C0607_03690 [Azoarcus sp.]|nr:MAG: hypothetical protein C0607_03690 [Azoarcus sp.]